MDAQLEGCLQLGLGSSEKPPHREPGRHDFKAISHFQSSRYHIYCALFSGLSIPTLLFKAADNHQPLWLSHIYLLYCHSLPSFAIVTMLLKQVACWLSLGSAAFAAMIPRDPSPVVAERQATTSPVPDPACTNGPRTRSCWSSGFSIATDFDAKSPPAGKTVTYNLVITNTTLNPDGQTERLAMLINNQYPGPVIRASWGDTLIINGKSMMSRL